MTSDDAAYVIAHKCGIILDKYLPSDAVDRIRELVQQVTSVGQPSQGPTRVRKGGPKHQSTIVIGKEFRGQDAILPDRKLREAADMTRVYPLLYVLENSIRQVINRRMKSVHGKTWWESEAPASLKRTVADRMLQEKKDSWHQRRGAHPIDYTDLKDLSPLMRKIQKSFVPDILPSAEWFTNLIEEVYKSRCVLCHMNPLDTNNIAAVKVRFNHWQKQIDAKKNLI